ncbi:DNA-binding protein [Paenibacillus ehimensis]|uniref:DNA-binding protein n=1 Tax=Paenibacillus ehimensis TaxID=79264 RepID=UPI00046F48BA|nr:DNA-binding protein [Paenibacillus ehimensis]
METTCKKKSLDDFPELMEVQHVREFMGIGRDQSYALMNSKQFHVVRSGRRLFVAKEVFRDWLHGKK